MNYVHYQQTSSNRLIGITVVILFHVGLVYALINGLGRHVIDAIKQPLEVTFIDPAPPPPPPQPQVEMPKVAQPTIFTPPVVDVPVTEQKETPPTVTSSIQNAQPAPTDTGAVTTPAHINKAGCRAPEYPPDAKRADESGTTVVSFLVGQDGKVHDSKIKKGSGSGRLDEAARAALSLCKFTPATVGGNPVAEETWTDFSYVWRLEN